MYANLVNMSQHFQPGDFLVFQLEAGFALLRLLAVDHVNDDRVWHVAGYGNFFLDVDAAEAACVEPTNLTLNSSHIALTNRAFESTQVAKISNVALTDRELEPLAIWQSDQAREVSDRSVRLMMGLR